MIAELRIQAALRNGKTFLQNSFHTPPFKLADITGDKNDQVLSLMVMSSSPGILDNDDYKIRIEIAEKCSVQLETQSYQRLFQMKVGAKQEMEVRMEKFSTFIFLPHPAVPHQSSDFSTKNKYYLSDGCKLILGEVLTCGRKLTGEEFRFSRYHSITEIFLSGKLVVKENLLMTPAIKDVQTIGQLEGFSHQASFTCVWNDLPVSSIIEKIHELLVNEKDICLGVSALPVNGFILRLLGYKAEQLYNILKTITHQITAMQQNNEWIKTITYAR